MDKNSRGFGEEMKMLATKLKVEVEPCPRCGRAAAVTYTYYVNGDGDALHSSPTTVRCSNGECKPVAMHSLPAA